jgi:hypothetical protein
MQGRGEEKMEKRVWFCDEAGETKSRRRGVLIPVMIFLVLAATLSGCSKQEEPYQQAEQEGEFRLHVYVVPENSEKGPNTLELTVYVDGRPYRYKVHNNEINHTMKVKLPSSATVKFEAVSENPASFHFKAYQDNQPLWGGGNGCSAISYSRQDKIHFYR